MYSSPESSSQNPRNNDTDDDANTDELCSLIALNKPSLDPYQQRLVEAAYRLLLHPCGVISTISVSKKIDRDAANYLVEQCLFLFTEDLFGSHSYLEPEGYIKYVPDVVDLRFVGQLLQYQILPEKYFENIDIPDVWKSYLSSNGIRILREMEFYGKILDLPRTSPSESFNTSQSMNNQVDGRNEDFEVTSEEKSSKEEQQLHQHDQENTCFILPPANIIANSDSIRNQIHDHCYTTHMSNLASCIMKNKSKNPNYKGITAIDDSNQSITTNLITRDVQLHMNNDHCSIKAYDSSVIDKPIVNWNRLRKTIIGLRNPDNASCYINAALQCLASTTPLVDWLYDQIDKLNTCQLSTEQKFCSICELAKVISLIHPTSTDESVQFYFSVVPCADSIRTHIQLISPGFNMGAHEDISEFIMYLFDHFSKCLSTHLSLSIPSMDLNIINQIFAIKLLSSGRCSSCSYTFNRIETMNILMIEINNLNSLTEALAHFVDPEVIDSFVCSDCQKSDQGEKRITIHELSPILTIHFKRYRMTFDSSEKLTHQVMYNELLDVSPYITSHSLYNDNANENFNESNNYLYKLYAVVNHIGDNVHRGHYYCYIRSVENAWFLVDDDYCQQVPLDKVLNNPEASMLFYAKVFHIPMNTNSIQQEQSIESLAGDETHDKPPTTGFNSSESTISNGQRNTFHGEQRSNTQSLDEAMKLMPFYDVECQDHISSTIFNMSPIIHQEESIIPSDELLPGQTESSITVTYRPMDEVIQTRQMSFDDSSSDDLLYQSKQRKITATENDTCSELTDETSDDEEIIKENRKKLASVASGASIEETYEKTLPRKYCFRLSDVELARMKQIRQQERKKECDRKMRRIGIRVNPSSLRAEQSDDANDSDAVNDINDNESCTQKKCCRKGSKVDIEYFNLLLPHLKQYNPACGLCIRSRYFGKSTSNLRCLLVKCILKCNGSKCRFKCSVHVYSDGDCLIMALNRDIFHKINERLSRPIRGSRRQVIIDKFKTNASVYRLYAEYYQKRTAAEKEGFNYDTTGKSKKVFKKIKAESNAESLLAPDVSSSIIQLNDELVHKINSNGIVKGALQVVQFRPFCIYVFTEASVRLYDALVQHPESVLSWDATGGIIKNAQSTSKQCLYYELTISHPNVVNEDSLVPLTFMLSESQTFLTVTTWLKAFKDSHKKIFPHKKDSFPRPAVILSDRAQVFLQAALDVFNDENYQQFLARAYRIVNSQATQSDLTKTNIHACLAHFMLDARKNVNKYLPECVRELGMWCIALLVNTATWVEMKENWGLICEVFFNYSTTETIVFKQHYSNLLSRINDITNDPNSLAAIDQSRVTLLDPTHSVDPNESINSELIDHTPQNINKSIRAAKRSARTRGDRSAVNTSIIDEEKQLNEIDSDFKQDLQRIYNECLESNIRSNSSFSSSVDKETKAVRQWLAFVNQRYMPTVAIWSNLLLGNLSRYITSSVQAFDRLLLNTHDQRTNAISERRMCIVKRTQLGTHTHMRCDVVLQILVQDMQNMIENFAVSYMGTATSEENNDEFQQQQLKELKENWQQKTRRGRGHYARKPDTSVMNNLKYSLVATPTTINEGLIVPHIPVVNWLNVVIGVLISMKSVRESLSLQSITPIAPTPIVQEILLFMEKWISSANRIKPPRKTSSEQMQLLNTKFQIPSDFPSDSSQQLYYILHKIILSIIDCPVPATKSYTCVSCKSTVTTIFNISYIPINVVDGNFKLNHLLNNYFRGFISDQQCDQCSMSLSRTIKLLDCPSSLIINVNHAEISSTTLRKPPTTVFFQSFLAEHNIGCSSTSIYDIVAFICIMPNTDNKLVLVTKIKQRWRVSSMSKLIGNGEKLCKLFANSRLIILERIRTCNSNFLYALAQCCSININHIKDDRFKTCKTLNDAVKMIETIPTLNELLLVLSSHFTTNYRCQNCQCSSYLLSTTHDCISIYEPQAGSPPVCATPLLRNGTIELSCFSCNEKFKNVILPVDSQVYHRYPSVMMYYSTRTTLQAVSNLHIDLSDLNKLCTYVYRPSSVLLIDEYNALSLVKLDRLSVFSTSPYHVPSMALNESINELFYTAQKTIVLFQQTTNTISAPLQLKSPFPISLVNKDTGTTVRGKITSLVISQTRQY